MAKSQYNQLTGGVPVRDPEKLPVSNPENTGPVSRTDDAVFDRKVNQLGITPAPE